MHIGPIFKFPRRGPEQTSLPVSSCELHTATRRRAAAVPAGDRSARLATWGPDRPASLRFHKYQQLRHWQRGHGSGATRPRAAAAGLQARARRRRAPDGRATERRSPGPALQVGAGPSSLDPSPSRRRGRGWGRGGGGQWTGPGSIGGAFSGMRMHVDATSPASF